MSRHVTFRCFAIAVFLTFLSAPAQAFTDQSDVEALQDLFRALNCSPALKGWRLDGVDPCKESWTGVSCSGSSVIHLKLLGLNLTGTLGTQLHNLHNLKQMDVSSNRIVGKIPEGLPPNATHINMACNNLNESIPYTLSVMKSLRHLNLSHNMLSGHIGNVFTGLQNLREMDLSFNNFSGDLPSSFGSLTNLTKLFLEHNKFTGSVAYLGNLSLSDLNIQENFFSGIIPMNFHTIPNLWLGGNKFHVWDTPPWNFPLDTVPRNQNISGPPTSESSAIQNSPSIRKIEHKKRRLGPGGIALMVGGATLMATCVALYVVLQANRSRANKRTSLATYDASSHSLPINTTGEEISFTLPQSRQMMAARSPPLLAPMRKSPIYHTGTEMPSKRKSFSERGRLSFRTKIFTVAELQFATDSFSEENLLGEGSLGSVYKAKFPDGQVLAVKNVNLVALSVTEEDQFLDVVWTASCLRHPNIVPLIGYCTEHGQHLLVYEYIPNLTLYDALHCDACKPLSWSMRIQIALGIARALDYLHSTFSQPSAHYNLKAANILLDKDLTPRISDCGLAVLRPLTSTRVKIKASEIAIGDSGYIAPEHGQPGIDVTKSDVYAFGVLLLELVTGRKPFDDSRHIKEQSLVKWASYRLHDKESLEQMVDPRIKGTFSSKTLSHYTDIVSLCIQAFRPPMTEIVESLARIVRQLKQAKSGAAEAEGPEIVLPDVSFRSTNTRFIGSPSLSILSS